jgi:hypothetical protein
MAARVKTILGEMMCDRCEYKAFEIKTAEGMRIIPVEIPHHSPYISGFNEGVNAVKKYIASITAETP